MLTYSETYYRLLLLYKNTGAGHMGGGISVLPTLYVLFNKIFDANKDMLVFSKGHTTAALYCALFANDYISEQTLNSFYSDNGTKLGGHAPAGLLSFIPFATGSLGHGLSLANGLALAKRYKNEPGTIYCICGDGEWQEGACWEAISFAVRHKLNNIVVHIDCNGWQGFGSVQNTIGHVENVLAQKLQSFGASVIQCNGECLEELNNILSQPLNATAPTAVLAKTVKGRGLFEYENTLDSHYVQMNDDLYKRIIDTQRGLA